MAYTWDYDRRGRVVRTSGDGGVQEGRMEYKDGYNVVHYAGTGATERYHFDDDGLAYLKVDALGGETWYGYNAWHEPTMVGTPEGKVVGREYDGRGNLVRLTHADGGEETWEYDGDNRTTAHTGPDGLREEWAFDAQGRLAAYKGPDGATAAYEYAGDGGRPSAVDYGDGRRLELRYGALGLPASVTDERGRCERFAFDAYGRQTAQAHRARDTKRPHHRTCLRQPLAVGPHAEQPGRGHHPWLRRRGAARERKSHRARHAAPVGGAPATRPPGPRDAAHDDGRRGLRHAVRRRGSAFTAKRDPRRALLI